MELDEMNDLICEDSGRYIYEENEVWDVIIMEALRTELKKYPSSFSVAEDIRTISNGNKVKLKEKLLYELCSLLNEFSTSMEKVRVWNLLSFLYFDLGNRANANKYNCEVLQISPNNIIALTNNAWFSFKDRKNVKVCEVTLKRLKSLKSDTLAYVVAKAELAFTYSRFGLKQYHNAISLFSEIKEDIELYFGERMQGSSHISPGGEHVKKCDTLIELKCVWTYGYAMTLQRLLHLSNANAEEGIKVLTTRHRSVFELYGEIVELKEKSECILRYKARALVEAGFLAYGVERNKFLFPNGMRGLLPSHSAILMPIYKYFETALEIFPIDVFVLERSGKYFRYVDDIEMSIRLLSKAIEIKGTSFGYHHLAVSYIRILEYNQTKLRHLIESIKHVSESSLTGLSLHGKNGNQSKGIMSLTAELARKCQVSDKRQFQTFPIGNISSQGDTSRSTSSISSADTTTIYNRLPKQSSNETAHMMQRQFAHTNTNLQYVLNPMAKTFIPEGQYKLKENFTSQEQGAQTIYRRSNDNDPGFSAGKEYGYSKPHFDAPVKNSYACKQHNKDKLLYENDKTGELPCGHTVGRNHYGEQRGGFKRNYMKTDNGYQTIHSNRPNVRQRNISHTKQHTADPKLHYVVKCLRFPKRIDYEKHKDVIDIAISYLDKSALISSNTAALYDKAVLYRQIKQNDKALEVLESLMQNDEDMCSNVMLANVYEQAAFCISDIIDDHEKIDEERAQQLIDDRQFYLKSSIEIACNIVAKHPYLGHCWRSAQTLRHILLSKPNAKRTKETLKDLWFLYNKLNNDSEVIGILKELKDLADDDAEKKEIIEEIVRKNLCLCNYEEAVIALCMLNSLSSRSCRVDQSLYLQVYIEAGLDAFRKQHVEKARLRIKKAFDSQTIQLEDVKDNVSSLTGGSDERFDLFILSDLDDEGPGRNLMMLLNNLGLRATFNTDSTSILPGTPEVEGLTKVMTLSKAFVILVNFDLEDKKMQHVVDRMRVLVEDRAEESLIMVIANPETDIPSTCRLSTYNRLDMDLASITETGMGNEDTNESLKNLLMALASI